MKYRFIMFNVLYKFPLFLWKFNWMSEVRVYSNTDDDTLTWSIFNQILDDSRMHELLKTHLQITSIFCCIVVFACSYFWK